MDWGQGVSSRRIKNDPYELEFKEITAEDIHRKELNHSSGNGPVPARASTSEADFARKFSDADIHLFVDHPMQGNIRNLEWDMETLKNELINHLKDHPGFPTGDQVGCYIFLQDKLGYIVKAPHFFLPSLRVNLNELFNNDIATLNEIDNFLAHYPKSAFVVKTGYSTNSHILKLRCSDKNAVYNKLNNFCN